jgi:hypothetical protein
MRKDFIQPAKYAKQTKKEKQINLPFVSFVFFLRFSRLLRANLLSRPCTFAALR